MMDTPLPPGAILAGKYRIERALGQGGMGVVMAARHIELGELFAVKFLLTDTTTNTEAMERFLREARASARLKGPHIAKVHDVGRLETGAPYMIMEHLEGADLKTLLLERGPLPTGEAAAYVLQACEAMIEAHAAGIVHRDIKPANLFLTGRPGSKQWIKVLDFGISKPTTPEGADITKTGATLGSPAYMSPEQMLRTRTVDERSDIWALGVVLYELVTGVSPFYGDAITEVVARVLSEEPEPPSALCSDLPEWVDDIVLRCLKKRPEERFQTAAELADALQPFVAPMSGRLSEIPSRPTITSVRPSNTRVSSPGVTATGSNWDRPASGPPSRLPSKTSVLAFVAIGAGAIVIGGAAWLIGGAPREPAGALTSTAGTSNAAPAAAALSPSSSVQVHPAPREQEVGEPASSAEPVASRTAPIATAAPAVDPNAARPKTVKTVTTAAAAPTPTTKPAAGPATASAPTSAPASESPKRHEGIY
jgi:serine/threonine-protein kinase